MILDQSKKTECIVCFKYCLLCCNSTQELVVITVVHKYLKYNCIKSHTIVYENEF